MKKEYEITEKPESREAAEFAQLNELAMHNAARKETIKAEKAKARFIAYTIKSILTAAALLLLSAAVLWAGTEELVHHYICVPVSLTSLCVAFLRFGVWFGRVTKK